MEHQEQFEELHKQFVEKATAYADAKQGLKDEDKQKLHTAKEEWQAAWAKFLETIAYLEQLEI